MRVEKIDHISIAVRNLDEARKAYEQILELELACTYVAEQERIRVARYQVGDIWLELMEPTGPGDVLSYLERHGEGVFLISYKVADVEEGLAELKSKGYRTIDEKPRYLFNTRYAFITHRKELCGVLTEILDEKGVTS